MIICLLCYRNFTLNYVYQEHFRHVHCAEFRFSCSSCGRGFWKETTLRQHVCVPDEKDCNTGKLAVLRDKMQQLKALNKSLFAVVSPYKSDAAADSDDKDNADKLISFVYLALHCTFKIYRNTYYVLSYPTNSAYCQQHVIYTAWPLNLQLLFTVEKLESNDALLPTSIDSNPYPTRWLKNMNLLLANKTRVCYRASV